MYRSKTLMLLENRILFSGEGVLLHAFTVELKMRDSCKPKVSKEV